MIYSQDFIRSLLGNNLELMLLVFRETAYTYGLGFCPHHASVVKSWILFPHLCNPYKKETSPFVGKPLTKEHNKPERVILGSVHDLPLQTKRRKDVWPNRQNCCGWQTNVWW